MKIKRDMFLDVEETKEVKELIRLLEENPESHIMGCGSMYVARDSDMDSYEVLTLRGHVTVKK